MEDREDHKEAETKRTHSKEEQEEEEEEEEEEKSEVGVKRRVSKLSHKRVETSPKLDEHWEVAHHSKESEDLWRSPEEQELQLMARTEPLDKRDEEGSGSRKIGV